MFNPDIDNFFVLNNIDLRSQSINGYACYHIESSNLLNFTNYLKTSHNLRFTILTDLFAADFPSKMKRFEVVYNLLSLELNSRILVKIECNPEDQVPSLTSIFSAAMWYEREIYDMFGIVFSNNNDLRRILTDYGFVGYPLRKDFPLSGHLQVKYDIELNRVIYEPVSLDQEYRNFDFVSPWQGPQITLPGDEKATK